MRVHDGAALTSAAFWESTISASRRETLEAAHQNWRWMNEVLEGRGELNRIFREVYRVPNAGIEVADDAAPLPVLPPTRLCDSCDTLREVARGAATMVVTYSPERGWQREMVRRLTVLVRHGVREFAVSNSLRKSNGMQRLHRDAPERFVIVRGLNEEESPATVPWPLPRVSVIEPGAAVACDMLALERPLHVLMVPMGTADPRHPQRKLGDDQRPTCRSWEQLERLLQL